MQTDSLTGVILAGGTGSRLSPLTNVVNKHLLPVGCYPMIFHPLARLVQMGIENICIVTGRKDIGKMIEVLGDGTRWGVKINYAVQHEPGGNAEALRQARPYVQGNEFVVIQGDNVFDGNLRKQLEKFCHSDNNAKFFLTRVSNPSRFGVAEVEGGIKKIVEKPQAPPSDFCVTGIYFYDSNVFELIDRVSRRENGELHLTDVNNLYLENLNTSHFFLEREWIDAGTFSSLQKANNLMADQRYEIFED